MPRADTAGDTRGSPGVLLRCLLLIFVATGVLLSPSRARSGPQLFGYAAVLCGHDDPFDHQPLTDYSEEVSGFTNANQVCVAADMKITSERLRRAARRFLPVFNVEPVFFDFGGHQPAIHAGARQLWSMVRKAIDDSGVRPGDMIFYLADEPVLRGLPLSEVDRAARLIRKDYPDAKVMVIEAFLPDQLAIPTEVDLWGFNAYAIRDPGADAAYVELLDRASALLSRDQSVVIVMDSQFTPVHRMAGLRPGDMAEVAWNYHRLASCRDDVSLMLGYTWAGGIDSPWERGVRDLPEPVIEAHRRIGRMVVAGTSDAPRCSP